MNKPEQLKDFMDLGKRIEGEYRLNQRYGPILHVFRGAIIVVEMAGLIALLTGHINQMTLIFIMVGVIDAIVLRLVEGYEQRKEEKRLETHYQLYNRLKTIVGPKRKGGKTK